MPNLSCKPFSVTYKTSTAIIEQIKIYYVVSKIWEKNCDLFPALVLTTCRFLLLYSPCKQAFIYNTQSCFNYIKLCNANKLQIACLQ